jgi:hypothetical protein
MPHYRVYKLTPDHRIVGPSEMIECDSDEDVIKRVKENLDGLDLEIWDGPRVVTRLKSTEK